MIDPKKSKVSHVETKKWRVKGSDGIEIAFSPVFVTQDLEGGQETIVTNKEVECKFVHMDFTDREGKNIQFDIGFQELFMFIYYCANEELRQQLLFRQEKHISDIPYEVTFKLDDKEVQSRMAKRLIRLPVDEITMAIARSEAQMLKGKATMGTLEEWFHKKRAQRSKKLL